MRITDKYEELIIKDNKMHSAALHPESRILMRSWRALNGLEGESLTETVRGRDASTLVDRLFLLQKSGEGVFTFRTVGKELKIWTGRDLREHDVSSIFHGPDKVLVRALLESAIATPGPALARLAAFGVGAGQRTDIEMVFLPLLDSGKADKLLGLFQPLSANINVSRPILRFSLTALLPPDPSSPIKPDLRVIS
jgi:hypothetical protein